MTTSTSPSAQTSDSIKGLPERCDEAWYPIYESYLEQVEAIARSYDMTVVTHQAFFDVMRDLNVTPRIAKAYCRPIGYLCNWQLQNDSRQLKGVIVSGDYPMPARYLLSKEVA